jgi:hypothetical protein
MEKEKVPVDAGREINENQRESTLNGKLVLASVLFVNFPVNKKEDLNFCIFHG